MINLVFLAVESSLSVADGAATEKTSERDAQTDAADAQNNYITIDEVKSIVLENARFVRLKLVSENGSGKYDMELVSGTVEIRLYGRRHNRATRPLLSRWEPSIF